MIRILQSHWFAGIFGLTLYVAVTAWCGRSLLTQSNANAPVAGSGHKRGPAWEFTNPEVDQLVAELNKEKAALAERSRQLNELEARLAAEQLEINSVTQSVHRLQNDLDEVLVRVTQEETANLKKLAKIYAAMSPEGAAAILKQIDEGSIVKIMIYMKEDETAPVLETLAMLGDAESKMAAAISERLRVAVFSEAHGKTFFMTSAFALPTEAAVLEITSLRTPDVDRRWMKPFALTRPAATLSHPMGEGRGEGTSVSIRFHILQDSLA